MGVKQVQMNYKVDEDSKKFIQEEAAKLDNRKPGWYLNNIIKEYKAGLKPKIKKEVKEVSTAVKAWNVPEGLNNKAWQEFDEHRRKHKSSWSDLAKTKSANILLGLSHEEQQATVDKSVQAGWPGLYPEKAKDNKSFIEKQNDSTFEQLFGKDEGVIEGECDVRE